MVKRPSPRSRARVRPLAHPVTITLDGEPIQAERGEPLAAALVAAGKMTLARSPKFHRPRGPSCMRAACDGCLARVNDAPNAFLCQIAAEDGVEVVSQNRLGPREADLLRMTDWFFPEGMNHHELFAGVPGVSAVMQAFARRVAGLGRLPSEGEAVRRAARRTADAVVVGAGPSGMAVASELAARGRTVEIVDDQLALGGSVLALGPADAAEFRALRSTFDAAVGRGAVRARPQTTAGGLFGKDLLLVGPDGAEIVEARSLVLACGAHDGTLAFEGNDLPGVMSARAAGLLLSYGVLVGERIVVVVTDGGGPFGESFARAAAEAGGRVEIVHGGPVAARGTTRVKEAVVMTTRGETVELEADALLVDAPRSPAYELCEQAGAALAHEPRGFVVRADRGRVAEGVYAAGEVTGVPFDPTAIAEDAARVAAAAS